MLESVLELGRGQWVQLGGADCSGRVVGHDVELGAVTAADVAGDVHLGSTGDETCGAAVAGNSAAAAAAVAAFVVAVVGQTTLKFFVRVRVGIRDFGGKPAQIRGHVLALTL